jgi:hypothetical protein
MEQNNQGDNIDPNSITRSIQRPTFADVKAALLGDDAKQEQQKATMITLSPKEKLEIEAIKARAG